MTDATMTDTKAPRENQNASDTESDESGIDAATARISEIQDTVKSEVEAGLSHAQDALSDIAKQTGDQLSRASEEGTRFVRENPGVAVAGAVGLGVLVGLALGKRS